MHFVSFNFYCSFILILSHLILKLHNCFAYWILWYSFVQFPVYVFWFMLLLTSFFFLSFFYSVIGRFFFIQIYHPIYTRSVLSNCVIEIFLHTFCVFGIVFSMFQFYLIPLCASMCKHNYYTSSIDIYVIELLIFIILLPSFF